MAAVEANMVSGETARSVGESVIKMEMMTSIKEGVGFSSGRGKRYPLLMKT